ncbi:MAG: ATP-binding protein [Spirochaetota bacterium]
MSLDLDLSDEAIQGYRQRRERINPAAPEIAWNKEELLFALGAAIRSKDSSYAPTICGLLCFGKDTALRRLAPMVRVDYIRVPGKTWIENPDIRFETIEMRGSLLTLISRVIAGILDDLPRGFSLEDGVYRKDIALVPDAVIREAVVNALMHRNYRTKQPVQIIRYSNRLEIRHPGCSLKPDDQLGEAGSVYRNEKIAAILHECNLAETKGSGIQAKALVFLKEFGAISNAAYRDINKVDTLHASVSLRRLRNNGILVQKGKGTATYYQGGPEFLASLSMPDSEVLPPKLEALSPNVPDLPPELMAIVREMGSRAKPKTSKKAILALCAHKAYSKKEISAILNRSEVTIGDLLGLLLEEGFLVLEFPETPNHPQQKYRRAHSGGNL